MFSSTKKYVVKFYFGGSSRLGQIESKFKHFCINTQLIQLNTK